MSNSAPASPSTRGRSWWRPPGIWLGPAPTGPFNPNRFGVYPDAYSYFRFFWDYAGGQLTDSGIHMLDIVQMAFGDPVPRSVVALGGKFWLQDEEAGVLKGGLHRVRSFAVSRPALGCRGLTGFEPEGRQFSSV